MKPWSELSEEDQLALRMAYDRATGALPGTCSIDQKIQRFTDWLAGQGVSYAVADLPPRLRPPRAP